MASPIVIPSSSPPVRRNPYRRARSDSLLEQQPPSKRQRRQSPTVLASPTSSSSGISVSQYYGQGDHEALRNIFATTTYPEQFRTWPEPQGSLGLNETAWEIYNNHEIFFGDDFTTNRPTRQLQRVAMPMLGPEYSTLPSHRAIFPTQPEEQAGKQPTKADVAQFRTALSLVRRVVGTERRLDFDLVQSYERVRRWREMWGLSPHTSDVSSPSDSPPPYSPPHRRSSYTSHTSSYHTATSAHVSSDKSSSPPPSIIPNPPIPGDSEPTVTALFDRINAFAKAAGFGIAKYNAYKYKGRVMRYTFRCDRFGEPKPSRGAGIKQRKSRKCGCKWQVIAEALEEGKWLLRPHTDPVHLEHNHPPSLEPSAHPSHRRLEGPVKTAIETTSRRVGIRARDVRAVVQEQFPESNLTQRDIYNARARINREKLGGYAPTAALIKLFNERDIPYVVKWADDEPNRLVGLVWTFPHCLQMWKRFPEVLSFDNTYNTNRFKLPLFQVTSQTCLGSIFNAAFGLIDNERLEGFQFLSHGIHQLLEQNSIRKPYVIITDYDKQMKAALNDEFRDSQQQLCIHHINSNVLLQAKRKWKKSRDQNHGDSSSEDDQQTPQEVAELSDEDQAYICTTVEGEIPHTYRGVLEMWKVTMYAETEDAFEKAWANLCKEFNDQRQILRYIYGTYMPLRAQWARCFIRHYPNFGVRVTSGTESSNYNIKGYLLNGLSHLYRLVDVMQDMLRDQESSFRDACAHDEVLTSREFYGPRSEYLGELRTMLSSKALGLVAREYRIAKKALPTGKNPRPVALGDCTDECSVSVQYGIPCCHKIYSKLVNGTAFKKWEVHPRWRLRESTSRDPYQRILDPKIATVLRGRPKNDAQLVPPKLGVLGSKPTRHPAQAVGQPLPGKKRGRPPGSRNKPAAVDLAQKDNQQKQSRQPAYSQRQTRSQSNVLGRGMATGERSSGRRLQPSIRRRRSEWEMLDTSP